MLKYQLLMLMLLLLKETLIFLWLIDLKVVSGKKFGIDEIFSALNIWVANFYSHKKNFSLLLFVWTAEHVIRNLQ